MTKLDFPDTPSTGQQYGSSGTVWRWDGTRWGSTAGAAGARGRVAYGQATANQTGIVATMVDIAGCSVTWTADPTRTYLITAVVDLWTSVANDVAAMYIRNAAGTELKRTTHPLGPATTSVTHTAIIAVSGLSGTQTLKMSAIRIAGTGTISTYAAVANPAFILVEDITYEAGSGGPVAGVTVPRFRLAGIGGGQNHTGQWVVATWGTTDFDNGTLTSGGAFFVPPALVGRWRFDYCVQIQAWNSGYRQVALQRSGGTAKNYAYQSTTAVSSTVNNNFSGSCEVEMTTGQSMRVLVYQDAGTLAINGDPAANYFQGQYVGPST